MTFCTLYEINMNASLQKVRNHDSSPSFESIRDELFKAKRERCLAERKWRNTKVIIFKILVQVGNAKVSKFVLIAECYFYTERIALSSSSKELHQVFNIFSNRHAPKIVTTIYPSADVSSLFIRHINNIVERLRANIASKSVNSTLVTGATTAVFSYVEKVTLSTVTECIIISSPKSCDLEPIPSNLILFLDYILPSLTDLFKSSVAPGIFP